MNLAYFQIIPGGPGQWISKKSHKNSAKTEVNLPNLARKNYWSPAEIWNRFFSCSAVHGALHFAASRARRTFSSALSRGWGVRGVSTPPALSPVKSVPKAKAQRIITLQPNPAMHLPLQIILHWKELIVICKLPSDVIWCHQSIKPKCLIVTLGVDTWRVNTRGSIKQCSFMAVSERASKQPTLSLQRKKENPDPTQTILLS